MKPLKKIGVDLWLVALAVFAWPINHAERLFGRALRAAGIRRGPDEGSDGSPR